MVKWPPLWTPVLPPLGVACMANWKSAMLSNLRIRSRIDAQSLEARLIASVRSRLRQRGF